MNETPSTREGIGDKQPDGQEAVSGKSSEKAPTVEEAPKAVENVLKENNQEDEDPDGWCRSGEEKKEHEI